MKKTLGATAHRQKSRSSRDGMHTLVDRRDLRQRGSDRSRSGSDFASTAKMPSMTKTPRVPKSTHEPKDGALVEAPLQEATLPQFKHFWTDRQRSGLSSTCCQCSAVIATNTDELALLSLERAHVCRQQTSNHLSHSLQEIHEQTNALHTVPIR